MRIISGQYGGRRFEPPRSLKARPTTDVAREALFNIIANRIDFDGIDVLDLFAGTGAISFEFISRGARRVVSVEIARPQCVFIRDVASRLGIPRGQHSLVAADSFSYIRGCRDAFDVVFADPPYALAELPTLPELMLAEHSPLRSGGLFILEHGKEHDFSQHPALMGARAYGAVHFSIFSKP